MTSLIGDFIEEPDLVFGYKKEEKDPRVGLKYLGPYFYPDESGPSPPQVKIGIVSDGVTTTLTKQFIESLKGPIRSQSEITNRWLYPDFPGFNLTTHIKCEFALSDNWNARLNEADVEHAANVSQVNERIAAAVNLYTAAVQKISDEDDKPHVIVCALPPLIEERCGISRWTRGAKALQFSDLEELAAQMAKENQSLLEEWLPAEEEVARETPERDLDFHNALKGKTMKFHIPVQLLRSSTIRGFSEWGNQRGRGVQEPATVAWNFGTAVYYKANGKPWRLAKLRQDTCFIGVSFYRNLRNPDRDIETSMAQVFTHNGEGIVLRGKDVVKDQVKRETHLSRTQALELMTDALKKYQDKAGHDTARVVVHKTSLFSEEEKAGFDEAIGRRARDYVTIHRDNDIRFLRTGNYPALRGTMVYLTDHKCVLYTSGYIPRVRTYPGSRVPEPLLITHQGDSELKEVCKEIMGLTKLNWNTTAFATVLPITLEFAKKVGKILSELEEETPPESHYRFYM
jgi:hypothetical protein